MPHVLIHSLWRCSAGWSRACSFSNMRCNWLITIIIVQAVRSLQFLYFFFFFFLSDRDCCLQFWLSHQLLQYPMQVVSRDIWGVLIFLPLLHSWSLCLIHSTHLIRMKHALLFPLQPLSLLREQRLWIMIVRLSWSIAMERQESYIQRPSTDLSTNQYRQTKKCFSVCQQWVWYVTTKWELSSVLHGLRYCTASFGHRSFYLLGCLVCSSLYEVLLYYVPYFIVSSLLLPNANLSPND